MTDEAAEKTNSAAAADGRSTPTAGSGSPRDGKRTETEVSTDRIVVRDKRRVDPVTGAQKSGSRPPRSADSPASADPAASAAEASADPAPEAAAGAAVEEVAPAEAESTVDAVDVEADAAPAGEGLPLGAELEALRAELEERTRDLQRVTAEYANYRKRVDRDRALVVEQATGLVLAALLPVLDDLDRAREHDDLVGPFGAVAEKLTAALGKFGLAAFGETGDPFDPTRHEAVAHQTSAEVTEPTCIDVLRRGYLLGERLLRPALVAVADPEQQ